MRRRVRCEEGLNATFSDSRTRVILARRGTAQPLPLLSSYTIDNPAAHSARAFWYRPCIAAQVVRGAPVSIAPTPQEMYERSADEGQRRLSASPLDVVTTGFLAGFTIVFGIIALGITHGLVAASLGEGVGKVAGALAFGIGLVFAIVGRSELFTENFLDPIAATIEKRPQTSWTRVGALWLGILVFNLVGGAALALLLTVEGALAAGAPEALARVASEIVSRETLPSFTNAIGAGALLTLMTYLVQGVNSVTGRMLVVYLVGFFLAIGPFNHVVVTFLHLLIGMRFGADLGWGDVALNFGISTAGNVIGGLVFITITQTARAKG